MIRRFSAVILVAAVFCAATAAAGFPFIGALNVKDDVFRQYMSDVEDFYKEVARGAADRQDGALFCSFYRYRATAEDTVIALAARCSIPYETLATLNRIPSAKADLTGQVLLLPAAAGIFLHETDRGSSIEKLTAAAVTPEEMAQAIKITLRNGQVPATLFFFPGKRYSSTERAFFLNAAFRFPLPDGVLTSEFGMRNNPVTGNRRFHKGVDLAAPAGTPVYAAREGVVTAIGTDAIYGNYVVIKHGNWESFYAHLQTVKKNCLNRTVESGYSIGTVGNTGQSTGPHLHFELRESGTVRNPEDFLLR